MSIAESFLPEFDQEIASTRKLLERIPDDKLDWKPHEKSMSMKELGTHISEVPKWAPAFLQATEFNMAAEAPPRTLPETSAGIIELFDTHAREARDLVVKTSDADFMVEWSLKSGDKTLFSAPRVGVFRSFVMNHMIHHRGQLTVYLRLNDVPLPAIYGPSADETGM